MLMAGSEKFRQVCNPRFPARAQHPDSQEEEKGIITITEMTAQLQPATSAQLAQLQSFSDHGVFDSPGQFFFFLKLISVFVPFVSSSWPWPSP